MPQSPCWPRDTLKDYLNGSADDQRLEAIETHLAECQTCEQTLLELERDPDTLVEAVRAQTQELPDGQSQANSEIGPAQSVINRAVEAVRQLGGPTSAPSGPLEKPGQIRMQQIGAYELLRPLGRGGMGLVLLARHSTLKKQVAIKILPSLIGDRPELVRRFEREIITAGQLNHPAIVHATDAGAEQGTHYLVMEYIDGLDLSRIARLGGPLSMADACELMRQAALGLSYAHAQGVVHRDVKPSNLMLDTSGRVKILDFGLAQLNLWEEAAVELTTVGQLMGTLDYMAPEQAERVGPVDYRADLYALGATLFRLLTGRAPLAASPNMTLLEKVRLLGSETPPLVSTLRDDCPTDIVRLLQQLLSRDPAARPASAAHIAEALLPFCEGHNLTTLLNRCRERATVEPALDETPVLRPLAAETPPVKPPRRSWLTLAWLAPLAICAGIFILLETQKGQLVIESDVAGVKVNVLQDGKVYQQLQVKTGAQSTRLLADKYAIEIDGASDEVVIDQSKVEIRRGDTVVARIREKSKAASADIDLSHIYDSIGVGDVVENKSKAASQSNLPQDLQIASLEVEAARARLEQQKKEADAQKAELAQKAYEYEQVKKFYPQGLTSELEYNAKRNSMEQAKSKLQKAEAQVTEFAMTLSAKELILESKVNAAAVKNPASSPAAPIAAQPMYAGKTLDQWLEVLKDLDTKTRLEALPGIVQLGKGSDKQVLKLINEALTGAIDGVANHYEWSNSNWRRVPRAEALADLINAVVVLNGNDAAFVVLREGSLHLKGKIASETLVVLYYAFICGMGDAVCDWLLSENRFQSLDRELAWAALTILETNLNYQDAEFCQALPKLVQDHPQLGLPAMLILWPPLGTDRQELAGFEEVIARAALAAFLDDNSSPTVIALSATRLAATTPLVEEFRSELVDKLKQRMSELAKDRDRLLEALPVGPPGVKLSYQSGAEPIVLDAFDATRPKKRVNNVARIVGSEMLGMLALAIRLKAVRELDEQLTVAAEPIFKAALPLAVAIQQTRKAVDWDGLSWPFPTKEIARLNEPLSSFPPEVWRAATIAKTIRELLDRIPLFRTKLLELTLSHFADVQIQTLDKNGDKQLWIQTEPYPTRTGVKDFNRDNFISKDEIISGSLNSMSRSFIGDKLGALGTRPEGFLTKDQAVPGISEELFKEIDADADGNITLDEGVDYLLAHPDAP